jgi:hypothetical protein
LDKKNPPFFNYPPSFPHSCLLYRTAAEKYPGARIIGTDISPIQPLWAAPNVEFHVEDLEDEVRPWTSIYGGADLFFIRATVQTLRHPRRLIERCFE